MNKGLAYFLVAILLVGLAIYLPAVFNGGNSTDPDFYLENSKTYLVREYDYDRSHEQLKKAIAAIRKIEKGLDQESKFILETSIKDLEKVSTEIEERHLIKGDLNGAYAKALDAMTYAEIKVSEHLLEEDHSRAAIIALKYGMLHLRNAAKFSKGDKKGFEKHIYEELDSLIENENMDHDEMKRRLDHMLEELDYLVEEKDTLP